MLSMYLSMIDTNEDKSLFEKVYYDNRTIMYNTAVGILKDAHLAEDAVQDAFFSLAKNIEKIHNRDCIEIRNYLIIIVRNAALKIYNKRKNEVITDDFADDISDSADVAIDTENGMVRDKVFGLIKKLDSKYGDALILKYYYDMKDKDIAASLGISLEAAKSRVLRGKKMLKAMISEEDLYE